MNEDKATRYHRQRRRAQTASVVVCALVLGLLAATRAAVWLREQGHELASVFLAAPAAAQLAAGAFVVLALFFLLGLATLPLSIFQDWVLDRRYGLDRLTFRTWITGHLKGALFGLVLSLGALVLLQASVALSANWWWLVAALTLGLAQLAITTLVPWLLPFFARLRPVTREALGERLNRLSIRAGAGTPLPVYEWGNDASARRAHAALVGLGRTKRVLLSDTLLESFGEDEIEVIVAHELAHHVHRDLWKGAIGRWLTLMAGLAMTQLWLGWAASRGVLAGPADPAALPLIVLVVGGVTLLASPAILAWSRRQERRADAFSLDLTGNPDAFIRVMRRMAALNLAEERPPQLAGLFSASHPPVTERLAAARAWRPVVKG